MGQASDTTVPMKSEPRRWLGVGTAILLLLFLSEGLACILANSQTSDEAVHLAAGYSYLARRDFRLNPEHPPFIKELAALPVYLWHRVAFDPEPALWDSANEWLIGRDFLYRSPVPADQILMLARIPNLVLGAALIGVIGLWAYRLWGCAAAFLGMALAVLEPNLVAHASLVTTDTGATFFTFLTVYLLWEYMACPSWCLLLSIGTSVGLALASKYSAILVPGLLVLILVRYALFGASTPFPWMSRLGPSASLGLRLLAAILCCLVIAGLASLYSP